MSQPQKRGRPAAGPRLSEDRIFAAALALIDQAGLPALTMRRLAKSLGADPMAIYYHVENRDALVRGVLRMVFAKLRIPAGPQADWRLRVEGFARAYRALAWAHPNLVVYLVSEPGAAAEVALPANEFLFAAFQGAGLAPRQILRAVDVLMAFLYGYVLAERSGYLGRADERKSFTAGLAARGAEFPVAAALFAALNPADVRADFSAELDVVLNGIAAGC
jgi:AcrR family transcriptional regulator